MPQGQLVFAQLMRHLPLTTFRRCVAQHNGEHKVKSFSCLDQFLCMAFAQLIYRESLRDIEANLRAQSSKLYATEPFAVDLAETVKTAIKLHTLLDPHGNIPSSIHISDGKVHDVNVLDMLLPEPGAYYVMDRGYLDFGRLHRLHETGSFFVTRAKSNLKAERRYSHPVDRSTGLICDQTVILSGFYSHKDFPAPLRRIKFRDPTTDKRLIFLTNQFTLPALSIAQLYRCRWQVELFFDAAPQWNSSYVTEFSERAVRRSPLGSRRLAQEWL